MSKNSTMLPTKIKKNYFLEFATLLFHWKGGLTVLLVMNIILVYLFGIRTISVETVWMVINPVTYMFMGSVFLLNFQKWELARKQQENFINRHTLLLSGLFAFNVTKWYMVYYFDTPLQETYRLCSETVSTLYIFCATIFFARTQKILPIQ